MARNESNKVNNDPHAWTQEQEKSIVEHIPLVRLLARRIHERLPRYIRIEDLFSAGVLGLMDAVRKFDNSRDVQFSTYAQFRIRGAIIDSLRTTDWAPRDLRSKERQLEEVICVLTARLKRHPDEEEIADELGLSLKQLHRMLDELDGLQLGSLNVRHHVGVDGSEEDEIVYIPAPPEDDPLFLCLKGEMRRRITDAVEALPERERLIMTLYYYEELTMKEIAVAMGVVESRVSQIHTAAVLHLRSHLGFSVAVDRRKARCKSPLPGKLDPRKKRTIFPSGFNQNARIRTDYVGTKCAL